MNIVLNVWIENKEEGSGTSCDVDLEFEKVEPPVSKFKNWMREEFILNIYKNDEWAPLWAVEDKAQRLGPGKGRDEEAQKSAQGKGGAKILH